jgi:hypothetical protein
MQNRLVQSTTEDLAGLVRFDQEKTLRRGTEIKYLICILCLVLAVSDMSAQLFDIPKQQSDTAASFWFPAYLESGNNNITDGIFLKTAIMPTYGFGKYTVQAGIRFDIISNNEDFLSGFSFLGSRSFSVSRFDFEAKGIYIRTGYSGVLHENKWGLLLNSQIKHFRFGLGTSFRTLVLNNKEAANLNDTLNTSIHENWNMLYLFSYYIKPIGSIWNINLSITNIDYFSFSQETNPIFKIGAVYSMSPSVAFFIDSGYQSAGILNMNIEYFGFFIKTGVIWKIWEKSN